LVERGSEIKNEYYNGEIFAMASASRKHNLILTNPHARMGTTKDENEQVLTFRYN